MTSFLPDSIFPARTRDTDKGNWAMGTTWNCIETGGKITDPVYSLVDAIWNVLSMCDQNTDNCERSRMQARLGMTESALSMAGWFLDIPNDCLGFTCAYRGNNKMDWNNWIDKPTKVMTLWSAVQDIIEAAFGIATGTQSEVLQCKETQGDSLIDVLGDTKLLGIVQFLHPTLISYAQIPWEVRAVMQLIATAEETDIGYQRAEKAAGIFEFFAAAVQSSAEARMGFYNASDGKQPESARAGCVAAVSHITASSFAVLGGIFKLLACVNGQRELPHRRDSFVLPGDEEPEEDECDIKDFVTAGDKSAYYDSCVGKASHYVNFGKMSEKARKYDATWADRRDKASKCYRNCCKKSTYIGSLKLRSMKRTPWCKKDDVGTWTTVNGWFDK